MHAAAAKDRLVSAVAALLRETLALWHVEGSISTEPDGLTVEAGDHRVLIARAAGDPLFTWRVGPRGGAAKPCGSILGVMAALRRALGGPEPAGRLRVGFMEAAP